MGNGCCCCIEKTNDEQIDISYREYHPVYNTRYYYQMDGGYIPLQSRPKISSSINYEYLCSFR